MSYPRVRKPRALGQSHWKTVVSVGCREPSSARLWQSARHAPRALRPGRRARAIVPVVARRPPRSEHRQPLLGAAAAPPRALNLEISGLYPFSQCQRTPLPRGRPWHPAPPARAPPGAAPPSASPARARCPRRAPGAPRGLPRFRARHSRPPPASDERLGARRVQAEDAIKRAWRAGSASTSTRRALLRRKRAARARG